MCSTINLTIKTGVLNVNVEYILHLALVFLQLSLSRYITVGCGFNLFFFNLKISENSQEKICARVSF